MRMVIQCASGVRREALLLALNKNRMRVMIADASDAVEFTLVDGCWVDERGETIEFEALLPMEAIDWPQLCGEVYPRTMAAAARFN